MKTAYLNPYGQSALEIIKDYGNITNIEEKTMEINDIINNTHNQRPKHVDTIKELCYEKIRQYYQYQTNKNDDNYNYLFTQAIEHADTIATHTLLQATAITYGSQSQEAELITQIITQSTRQRLEHSLDDDILDASLSDYINIHNTQLKQLLGLINTGNVKLNHLLVNNQRIILTYEDFIDEYSSYLQHRRPEKIYQLLCNTTKKDILIALIEKQTRQYLHNIESMLKQVEPAKIIKTIAHEYKEIETKEREKTIQKKYGSTKGYTNYNDDKPTPYLVDAFPPCVKKALNGIKSGGRNYTISLFLTPFLSYARLYPGVYAGHIQNAKITDFDPTLTITHEEILPLIHKAADNCNPPLFKDQPQEKANITSKLGFAECYVSHENCGKTPWYKPANCKSIQQQQPTLCTPCEDCKKIGNPLSYYNRKRKMLLRKGDKENATSSNKRRNKTILP